MIRLRSDCLEFELSNGEKVPCSAETVTVELMGPAVDSLERHIVENATAAVLHYFHVELKKTSVTLSEFTAALEVALRGLGINVVCDPGEPRSTAHSDLRLLAADAGKSYELAFFGRLRDELRTRLRQAPSQLRFFGLRGCVKQLSGARRWSSRCQALHDQIVDYIRGCVVQENLERPCDLLVH
jgi:hypothetical protein